MAIWYESHVDRQIREARERGEFDDLPGAGKPLSGYGRDYDEDWWVREWVRRERVTGVLPPALALRRQAEDLAVRVPTMPSEAAVRSAVTALNEKIVAARRGPLDGPPVVLRLVDVDEMVRRWRDRTG